MKQFASIVAILVAAAALSGQRLEIKGDVKTVKVGRVVVVKEDLLLVSSLPFEVKAPAGGFGYVWSVPAGFDILKKGSVIEIKSAPKGNATISCEWYVVDFDKRLVESKFESVSFAVGDVPQPIPPKPPDPPPGPLPGKRAILLIEESSERTPEMANLLVSLRTGQAAKYFSSKGHSLVVLDKDSVGPDKLPSQVIKAWEPYFRDLKLPALIITDYDRTVPPIYRGSVNPLVDGPDAIVNLVKKAGG